MEIAEFFPVWDQLTPQQQTKLKNASELRHIEQGTVIHNGSMDCLGLLLICSGQLRSYILSEEGREVTLYRLFPRDICLFSASCMMNSIQFDITVETEKDCELWVVRPEVCKALMEESAPMANYISQIMASRFSEVMWLIEQILWKSLDRRLAEFLLDETSIEKTSVLRITHEKIGNHLGTAREVVTRMLRYFQGEGLVRLSRGQIEVTDRQGLHTIVKGETE